MNFTEILKPYVQDGRVSLLLPWEANDNHLLFGSTAMFVARKLQCEDFAPIAEAIKNTVESRRLKPGLFEAFPSWGVNEVGRASLSHDELLGVCATDRSFAREVVRYGQTHFWIFNNRGGWEDTPRSFMGRFPILVAYAYSRARIIPLHPFWHLGAIKEFLFADLNSPYGETSGKCRRLLVADFFYKSGFFPMRWAAKIYLCRLQKQYGDISGLYSVYFPNHPFAEITKGVSFT